MGGDPTDIVGILRASADLVLQTTLVHLVLLFQAVQVEDVVPQEVVFAGVIRKLDVGLLKGRTVDTADVTGIVLIGIDVLSIST